MRITLVFGALGLAVGGVFALVLRLVSGRSVVAGLGRTGSVSGSSSGFPRRYADYLPTSGRVTHPDWLPLVPVSVGTGLVAGRVAVAQTADFGWYAYSPLTSSVRVIGSGGILYSGGSGTSSWWSLVLTGVVVGVAVGLLAGALCLLRTRRVSGSSPTG